MHVEIKTVATSGDLSTEKTISFEVDQPKNLKEFEAFLQSLINTAATMVGEKKSVS